MMQTLPDDHDRENFINKLFNDCSLLLNSIIVDLDPQAAAAIYRSLNAGAVLKCEIVMIPQPSIQVTVSSPDGVKRIVLCELRVGGKIETNH